MFSDISVPFPSCCLLIQNGGGRGLRDKHKQTNIKTVDLSGAAALANELRHLEKRRRKREEMQKTRKGGRKWQKKTIRINYSQSQVVINLKVLFTEI